MSDSDSEVSAIRALKMAQMRMGMEKPKSGPAPAPVVEVYSTPTCPYCVMAKQYLNSKKVAFKDIDVSRDMAAAQRMMSATQQMGVPQLHINGEWIVGFDRHAIDEALQG
ncbi:putative Thioredoxin [uncultured archaeon]|nr:putative Thioredoxin [uncultured archaeon]